MTAEWSGVTTTIRFRISTASTQVALDDAMASRRRHGPSFHGHPKKCDCFDVWSQAGDIGAICHHLDAVALTPQLETGALLEMSEKRKAVISPKTALSSSKTSCGSPLWERHFGGKCSSKWMVLVGYRGEHRING